VRDSPYETEDAVEGARADVGGGRPQRPREVDGLPGQSREGLFHAGDVEFSGLDALEERGPLDEHHSEHVQQRKDDGDARQEHDGGRREPRLHHRLEAFLCRHQDEPQEHGQQEVVEEGEHEEHRQCQQDQDHGQQERTRPVHDSSFALAAEKPRCPFRPERARCPSRRASTERLWSERDNDRTTTVQTLIVRDRDGPTMDDSIRVLHVDDEPGLAEVAAEFLERQDDRIEVVTATAASDGLDRLADGGVDCVVSITTCRG